MLMMIPNTTLMGLWNGLPMEKLIVAEMSSSYIKVRSACLQNGARHRTRPSG